MPMSCIVPKCKTGYKSDKSKRSVFRVPKDPDLLKKWKAAIPGNVELEPSHCVCDKHFHDELIIREWIKTDRDGNIIAKVAYKRPQLSKIAVPTKFDEDMEEKAVSVLIGETKEMLVKSPSAQQSLLPSVIQKPVIQNSRSSASDNGELLMEIDSNDTESCTVDSSTANISLSVVESRNDEDIADNEDPAVHGDEVHLVPQLTDCGSPLSTRDSKVYTISLTAVTFSQQIQKPDRTTSTCGQYSATIPRSWTAADLRTRVGQCVVFSRTTMKIEGNNNIPILQRCVTLDDSRKLEYFVYGHRVNTQGTVLNEFLEDAASLSHTLESFERMGICNGLDVSNNDVRIENALLDCLQQWRHNDCTLISKRKRCESCMKLRNQRNRLIKSMTSRPTLKRIRQKASNPFDQCKIAALLKRSAYERRKKLQAQGRVNNLMKTLREKKDEIAGIKDVTLESKCAELNVSNAQRLALKEIIIAAGKKDVRGHRYTDEWMMLCMLMIIRWKAFYEFLRKNIVLPLPCTRTIRSYFSLINLKCGFDEQFAELLKKHFASKTPLQRHGVLLLDEINLRKSVAVCSKNLTYVGLTDLGEDGAQSNDITDQATHGLVMMFQPLADKCPQPIAVFASKNPVNGEELSKLTVKGISYLENCGAKIQGVIADGAATNAKMWSLLGVNSSMEDTKIWFTHPLDDERKIYVFSDVPHLIKCIRNSLHSKQQLRLTKSGNYIRWQHFVSLYHLDKNHPGNAKVCPRITSRHVILDNTSKMRVRLATQIFSNSVAQGLSFYSSHGCAELNGCEETISFCKRINDMFDALNRKSPNEGLVPGSTDFKVLEDSLRWLNDWESAMQSKDITPDEFLTPATSKGLRLSLNSTMDMCGYLIKKFDFQYLLSGKGQFREIFWHH